VLEDVWLAALAWGLIKEMLETGSVFQVVKCYICSTPAAAMLAG
jgi:hypothetical protein